MFQELESILQGYLKRFSEIAGSMINCGSILNWLEVNCLEWPADFWFPCSWLPLDLCSNYSLSARLWLCGRKGGDSVCRDVMFNPLLWQMKLIHLIFICHRLFQIVSFKFPRSFKKLQKWKTFIKSLSWSEYKIWFPKIEWITPSPVLGI